MNINYIKEEVERINDFKSDDETAHTREDDLRAEFIKYVSETAGGELAEMAREVLKTDDISFARWCA